MRCVWCVQREGVQYVYMEEVKYIWKSTTDFKISCGEADG